MTSVRRISFLIEHHLPVFASSDFVAPVVVAAVSGFFNPKPENRLELEVAAGVTLVVSPAAAEAAAFSLSVPSACFVAPRREKKFWAPVDNPGPAASGFFAPKLPNISELLLVDGAAAVVSAVVVAGGAVVVSGFFAPKPLNRFELLVDGAALALGASGFFIENPPKRFVELVLDGAAALVESPVAAVGVASVFLTGKLPNKFGVAADGAGASPDDVDVDDAGVSVEGARSTAEGAGSTTEGAGSTAKDTRASKWR